MDIYQPKEDVNLSSDYADIVTYNGPDDSHYDSLESQLENHLNKYISEGVDMETEDYYDESQHMDFSVKENGNCLHAL